MKGHSRPDLGELPDNEEPRMKAPRYKPMDVVFGDTLLRPRRLVLAVIEDATRICYEACSESGGSSTHPEYTLRTLDEWLNWVERFSDDLTGRQLREAKEAARAPFDEPRCWIEFRQRFAATGDPWLKETTA